ncbi:MAG: hypothetical protein HYY96_18015 [Candidatus Tectomicrobia bacterium]|nr:hypothetical protein [Candidatus Tectomicrobia bacterium]
MDYVEPFGIACLQSVAHQASTNRRERDKHIHANLERAFDLMDYVASFGRSDVRFIVMPEYGINGAWKEMPVKDWMKIAVPIPGPVTDLMGQKAKELGVYIVANMAEVHDDWPGRFFNTSFIISPTGEVVLKHWKINNNSWLLPYTTPSDIYSEFVERYGRQALFPVLETPHGRVGVITCGELLYPENARCTMLNGAEIIFHCTSESLDYADWGPIKITRAIENKAIFATCNIGVFEGAKRGVDCSHGGSMIINHEGQVLAKTGGPGEASIRALVDVNALRAARSRPFYPASIRAELFAREYAEAIGWPLDGFLEQPIESIDQTRALFRSILEKLYDKGVYTRPYKRE